MESEEKSTDITQQQPAHKSDLKYTPEMDILLNDQLLQDKFKTMDATTKADTNGKTALLKFAEQETNQYQTEMKIK